MKLEQSQYNCLWSNSDWQYKNPRYLEINKERVFNFQGIVCPDSISGNPIGKEWIRRTNESTK